MRLEILNSGYRPGTKLLFALIQLFSRQPVPDAAKLVFYRPDFYGSRAKEFTHEAMRGPSAWSVADRELMAAYVSTVNESAFCVAAHSATARQAYQDGPKVAAVLADPAAAGPGLAQELIDYCRARLAHFKCPRTVDFAAELPRSETGKLYKRILRDAYWAGHQSSIV